MKDKSKQFNQDIKKLALIISVFENLIMNINFYDTTTVFLVPNN